MAFVPVVCGSAFKNKGVQPLLDAVDRLSAQSPLDVPAIQGLKLDGDDARFERPSSDDVPFSALAFKIMNDPFVGTLTFARIYSGKLEDRVAGPPIRSRTKRKRSVVCC